MIGGAIEAAQVIKSIRPLRMDSADGARVSKARRLICRCWFKSMRLWIVSEHALINALSPKSR